MTWSRLDDTLHSHPKALDADLEAMGLWVMALSSCGAYLTDGHIKRSGALRIAGSVQRLDRLAGDLVRVGLWEPHPSGDGWQFHDFLDFNPPKLRVIAEREAKSRAGKETAARRWGSDSSGGSSPSSSPGSSAGNSADAPATPAAIGVRDAPVPIPSRPDPSPVQTQIPTIKDTSAAPPTDSRESANVRAVFDHWASRRAALTGASLASLKLTDKRKGRVRSRLREGYTVDQLTRAVDGMLATPFNVDGHHTDLELACRDAEHVDRYMAGPPRSSHRNGFQQQPAEGPAFAVDDGTGGMP